MSQNPQTLLILWSLATFLHSFLNQLRTSSNCPRFFNQAFNLLLLFKQANREESGVFKNWLNLGDIINF